MKLGNTARKPKRANAASFSKAPKKGSRQRTGPSMGGTFNLTAKKPEPDNAPRTLAAAPSRTNSRAARMKRLDGKLI